MVQYFLVTSRNIRLETCLTVRRKLSLWNAILSRLWGVRVENLRNSTLKLRMSEAERDFLYSYKKKRVILLKSYMRCSVRRCCTGRMQLRTFATSELCNIGLMVRRTCGPSELSNSDLWVFGLMQRRICGIRTYGPSDLGAFGLVRWTRLFYLLCTMDL